MLQIIGKAILCELALDRISRSTGSNTVRISSLDHEAVDHAVKDQTVIKTLSDE